jgi:signal transduction histidine kinase
VRRRLVITYLLLLCMVLLALEIPLAATVASRETDGAVADRMADATRFASLAAPAVRSGDMDALNDELRRYSELYGIGVLLFDQDQVVLSAFGTRPAAPAVAVRGALAGHQVSTPGTMWPWVREPLMVAVPVSDGGAVLGVVLTVSPTDRSRRDVLVVWLLLTLVGVLAVAACLTTADRLASWVLRPVTRLDAAAHEIAEGDSAARVVPGLGPPELRRLSASFNEMADAVSEAMERQRSFVAHASHQLRNPLTVLRLSVDNLEEHVDQDGRPYLELAAQETERLAAVVDRLLELARAEASDVELVPVDVAEVAKARLAAWRDAFAGRGVPLTLARLRPDQPAVALGDPELVGHALDTMLGNALKFAAGAPVRVEVGAGPPGGAADGAGLVEFAVVDHGPGVPPDELALVGRRFWRSPGHQNVDGTGLGLATSRILVESAGGWMQAEAVSPHGLRVAFWLPRVPADPA